MEKMKMETIDIVSHNVAQLGKLFPNCVSEIIDSNGSCKLAVNMEVLQQMLTDTVLPGDESYEFSWVGKKAAIAEAHKIIRKTLRPDIPESRDWDITENLYIEGDNLEALKLLQESYLAAVKLIYIDPPYNTGTTYPITINDIIKITKLITDYGILNNHFPINEAIYITDIEQINGMKKKLDLVKKLVLVGNPRTGKSWLVYSTIRVRII